MRRLSVLAILLFLFHLANSQTVYSFKKAPTFGVHFFFNDFQTPADIKASSMSTVLNANQWYQVSRMDPGIAFTYTEGLTDYIDYNVRGSFSFVRYPFNNRPASTDNKFFAEVDAAAHLKLVKDNHFIAPYLSLGVGASSYSGYFGAILPLGAGLQFNIFDNNFIFLNTQYRIGITENTSNHLFHSIGFAQPLTTKKVEEPKKVEIPVVEPPKDRDGDGIIDSLDACPDTKGIAKFNGCPDTDGDGIADKEDKCPTVPGLAKYNGCPIPDSDKDGINDEEDKCPTVAGLSRYQGCPIPDTDKDGVNDEEDKCPNLPGIAANQGCPEIKSDIVNKVNLAAKNIYFNTGSTVLVKKSEKSLDGVATILKENPELRVKIEGHTDNTGKPEKNLELSKLRAASVLNYLVKKGIDAGRLSSEGFGQENPLAENKTAQGRAQNRRVEMKLKNY